MKFFMKTYNLFNFRTPLLFFLFSSFAILLHAQSYIQGSGIIGSDQADNVMDMVVINDTIYLYGSVGGYIATTDGSTTDAADNRTDVLFAKNSWELYLYNGDN